MLLALPKLLGLRWLSLGKLTPVVSLIRQFCAVKSSAGSDVPRRGQGQPQLKPRLSNPVNLIDARLEANFHLKRINERLAVT